MSESKDLPKGWHGPKESKSHPGKFYYYNSTTNEKSWVKPEKTEEDKKREREEEEKGEKNERSPKKAKREEEELKEVQCLHILRKHK